MVATVNPSNFTSFGRALERGEFRGLSPHSLESYQIWSEQLRYCLNGYESGGVKMTGKLYAYVNFGTIEGLKSGNKKELMLPELRDVEWLVFGQIQRAEEEKKNLIWMSGRRGGKSYILSFLAAYYYTFYDTGKAILGGATTDYSDDVCKKAFSHIRGFNLRGTQLYRSIAIEQWKNEIRSGRKELKDGSWITVGDSCSVYNICYKNNHQAAVGKSCNFVGIDEIGKFENLIASYAATDPLVKEGTERFGMVMLTGTGGDMEKGTQDAYKMFNDPDTYDLLSFWDDQAFASKSNYYIPKLPYKINKTEESPAGFFIPAQLIIEKKYRDEFGNANQVVGLELHQKEREKRKTGKDLTEYFKYMQYYPFTIGEVFLSSNQNIFPIGLLQDHLEKIVSDKTLSNAGIRGELIQGHGSLDFRPNPDLREAEFPVSRSRSNRGCIVIYEHPIEINGVIPDNLYIAGTDPYAQDQASTSPSLGSTFIYKRFLHYGTTENLIVAEYTGRPETSDEYYENLRLLLKYYNAKCLYENNIPGLKQYFETKNSLYLLARQPKIVKDVLVDSKVERTYGLNMSSKMKSFVIEKVKDWLLEEYAPERYNLEKILSINLLKELINYNADGNFDRVISFGLCLIQDLEWHRRKPVEDQEEIDIFSSIFERMPSTNYLSW